MALFEDAVRKTIIREGGATYTNDKDDPGGETKFGISHRSFPEVDIRNLTEDGAKEIYRLNYWNKIQGDNIQSQTIAENIFDTAVNMGVVTTIKLVQISLEINVTGNIDANSLSALNNANEEFFMSKFVIAKIARYANLCNKSPKLNKYLLGWINRTLGAAA